MKNKMIIMFIATVLFLSVISIPLGTNHASAASKEGIVTADILNVREKASTSSKKMGTVKKGQVVTITKQQNGWSQIKYGSKNGWVSEKYISTVKTTSFATTATTTKYYVTASSLNIRESASTSAKIVASLTKGASVTYYSKSGNWAKVKTASGVTGWASMTYLTKTKPVVTKIYYVTANFLNVRSSGSTSAKVVATIKKGASVTFYSQRNNWGEIKTSSGVTGYVSMKYLSTTKPNSNTEHKVETASNNNIYYVISDTLNIRDSGDVSADIVDTSIRGDALTLTKIDGAWGKVITEEGVTGWVNLTYLSSTAPSKGLKGKVIVLDPGHGGKDPGSHGDRNNEKDLTLATAKKVKAKLEAVGAKVVMTRTGDTYLTLSERVKISENNNADVFISIHYNAGSSSASGIETYFWKTNKDESKLASLVQNEIIKSTGMKNRGTAAGDFHVIRENTDSAILVELGFISNPDEENIIETSDFQNKAATGIVNGLEAYFD